MTIKLKHFDTLTKQDLDINENIKNSLAEYLFPDVNFAVGSIYQDISVPEHLDQYQDKTLQFASGDRMYFGDSSVRSLVYPNQSDGAAYGSLVFTPCQSFQEINARVLIINDETGANGGIMPANIAKELVGDCYGKISPEIAEQLTGVRKTPFQFRLGIKPQAQSPVHRIAKGTLAPATLDNLSGAQVITKRNDQGKLTTATGYDLILPTSSFKGRKEGYDPIEPGEYNLKLGIGIKTLAKYGEQSLGTQVLVNYPKAVSSEILPKLQNEAKKLAANQSSPQQLAQQYIELYERRKELVEGEQITKSDFEELEGFDQIIDEAFGEGTEVENTTEQDWTLYRLLKADTQGKITEHPKIVDELNKFVKKRWVEIATGRAIKFQAGLAQPSLKLKEDEICVPTIPNGKEVIVTRSPLINSNGVIVLKNRHLKEAKHLIGAVHINPVTAAKHLQCDFDGDRLAFESADKYPVLAAEVKEYNQEQNRYPDIVKKDKVPYQGNFPEIALSAADNKIGLIANQIQRGVANRWETLALPDSEKLSYIKNISQKYKDIAVDESTSIPDKYQERVNYLANLPASPDSTEITKAMETLRSINFDLVADLGNELQVAVDGPKSAARPDELLLNNLKAVGGYKYPQWLYEKKNPQAYFHRPMKSNGYSPIDLMVKQTNQVWKDNQLTPQPTESFRGLFKDIEFTPQQERKATSIRNTYNNLIGKAIAEQQKINDSPILKVTSRTSGKTIEISNLVKTRSAISSIYKANKLDIGIRAHEEKTKSNQGTLRAVVIQENGIERDIGIISAEQVSSLGLKDRHGLKGATVEYNPGITKATVKAMFAEASDYLERVRNSTPNNEKSSLAAALWHVSHTKNSGTYVKKASVAVNLFPDQVINQLQAPPTQEYKVVGVAYSAAYGDKRWQGEEVNCEIAKDSDSSSFNYGKKIVRVEGKTLAPFSSESTSLPVGTKFKARINSPPGAGAIATTRKGNTFKVTQLKNGAFPAVDWQGETVNLKVEYDSLGGRQKPVAKIDNKILGILDKESTTKLQSYGLVSLGTTLPVTLVRSPATTANLTVDTNSIVYPWQTADKDNQIKSAVQEQPELSLKSQSVKHPSPSIKEVNSTQQQSESISQSFQNNNQSIKEVNPAGQQSLDNAQFVAKYARNFLLVKNTDRFVGKQYIATWNQDRNSLMLQDIEGKTKLQAEYVSGEWRTLVNNLGESDVRFFSDLKPLIEEKLSPDLTKDQQKQLLREEYQRLSNIVRNDPNYTNSTLGQVDTAIAKLVINDATKQGQTDHLLNRVGKILSQSDRARYWKQSLPDNQYKSQVKQYIVQQFEMAKKQQQNLDKPRSHNFDLIQ
ncbi:MAG: hypothetical protein QNJ70_20740 [Xenococcaceae cyanobacterium MO_207.B15]|nr:hypothetical protein [Xenococcaceae cyanobacterium MO_207.B15]